MQVIREHLELIGPRFSCRDTSETRSLTVTLSSAAGDAATDAQLEQLQQMAGEECAALEPLYRAFNGLVFHRSGESAGLVVASIDELEQLNSEWREWLDDLEPDELYEFQRDGFAFATIAASGNYFVVYREKVYYSDHDGGDDSIWGETVTDFFTRALVEPARFLREAGCYTRYSDGQSDAQFIPESFSHD